MFTLCGHNLKKYKYSDLFKSQWFHINLQGVAPKQSKDSSVKKLFIIGVVPEAPENHYNVKAILDKVDIETLEFTVSADVKMRKNYYLWYYFLSIFSFS